MMRAFFDCPDIMPVHKIDNDLQYHYYDYNKLSSQEYGQYWDREDEPGELLLTTV